jgi:Asp-tRNA(Asn)/Glu-tRNA(Gln) amidotransferase A subunit family amidase
VKDCIDTAAYPTTSGTPKLDHYQPNRNAVVVQRLLDAGAIIAGKANMHELAYGITSNNAHTGAVRNPYDLELIPGGSSGGSAAAVAAGIANAGLGTDTGGSIRIPAALCGIAGLRTTLGRWPVDGMMPASHSRDVIGPFGRSVSDLALIDSVISGEPLVKKHSLKGLRLGVPRSTAWEDLDPATAALAEAALVTLQKAGVTLVDIDMRDIFSLDQQHGFPIALFETLLDIPPYLIAGETGVSYDDLIAGVTSPAVKAVISQAPSIPYEVYREALAGRARMRAAYAILWKKHDIAGIIFPTTPMPARPIGQEETVELNGRQVPTFPTYIRNTGPGSTAEIPGLSLPIGLTPAGLPVGLELDGPSWSDRQLLGIGLSIERLFDPLPQPTIR